MRSEKINVVSQDVLRQLPDEVAFQACQKIDTLIIQGSLPSDIRVSVGPCSEKLAAFLYPDVQAVTVRSEGLDQGHSVLCTLRDEPRKSLQYLMKPYLDY